MISVDEEDFLIATDIDKLIEILSTKKDVEVGKLSKELKMNRKEVEKWLNVLEEEGVVTLANRMGSLYAVWVMEGVTSAPPKKQKSAKKKEEPLLEIQEVEDESVELELEPMKPHSSPKKSLFSGIFKGSKKKKVKKKKEAPKLKFEEEEEEPVDLVHEVVRENRYTEPSPPVSSRPSARMAESPVSVPAVSSEAGMPMKKRLEKSDFLKLPPRHTGKLRERLEDYLQLIREGKEELKTLEGEKEKIHREGFLSLEKEFEANLDNIEFALLEKEKRILEAKEKLSTLPEKVEELDNMQDALQKFDGEAKEMLSKTKQGLDKGWTNLREVSEELSEELTKGEEEAMRDRSRMMQLRDMLQSMETAESQLKETLEAGRSSIEEMEEKVRTVEESLEDLVDSRVIITERIEHIHSTLERRMRSLDELREELERIEKIESWFKEYSDDYQGKIDELQDYVQQSEEELERIRKAAELEYVKGYLKELDTTEDKYRENLGALEMEGASVDEKISEVRGRIKQLMRESSELMSKYRQMAEEGTDFEEAAVTAKERSKSHRRVVEEKANQRRKIMEDAKSVRRKKKKSSKDDKKKRK